MRVFLCAELIAVCIWCDVSPVSAQPFPASGTGPFTWEQVGNRPASILGFNFISNSYLVGSGDDTYIFNRSIITTLLPRLVPGSSNILALDGQADTLFVNFRAGMIKRSVDGGVTWQDVLGSLENPKIVKDAPEGFFEMTEGPRRGRILAGAGDTSGLGYSDDRGATWHQSDLSAFPISPTGNFVDFGAYLFRVLPSGRVLAGGEWGIATSDDSGSSWAPTVIFQPFRFEVYGMAAVATPGSSQTGAPACGQTDPTLCDGAIALGIDARLPHVQAWRTNDGGRTWSEPVALPEPPDGIAEGYAAAVISLGTEPNGLGRALAILGRGVIYATRDGGQSWTAIGRLPITLDYNWVGGAQLGPDGHLWVGTTNAGPEPAWMYRSAEPATAAFAVAGEGGPSEASPLGVTVRPNPAGGQVEVVLTSAEASDVRVVVVDALGREVAVVLDGAAGAGERVVGVDTASWPPGVYVVRATAGAQMATARLVVAR